MNNLTMHVCLNKKRVCLSRTVIRLLGNPTHLSFWYDEFDGKLMISSADKDDLDAYEIPKFYWNSTRHSCEVARIAFLIALQYRIGWEAGSKYVFEGALANSENIKVIVFDLVNGARQR